MANNSFDLKNIGVIYLSDLTTQDFPAPEVGVGHVLWNGSGFIVQTDNQGPVYTSVPSYNIAQQSLEVYEPNDTVVIPTYSVVTGDYRIRDSNGNDYVPRASVATQNVAIIGSANVNNNAVCVGGVYLKAGTTIDAASEAYMSLSGGQNPTSGILYLCASNTFPAPPLVASWTLLGGPTNGRVGVPRDPLPNPALNPVLVDGWYDFILSTFSQSATVEVFGLRLVVT